MSRTGAQEFSFRPKQIAVSVAVCFALHASQALSNPTGPTVISGSAGIATAGNTLTVTNSTNAIINWQGFSIGANEITRFTQPSASSAVLNRVVGTNGVVPQSLIDGVLSSNGRVFLLNPMGIVIGAGARIDVAGLVASTLNLSDQDFLNGRLRFTEVPGAGAVVNHGVIETPGGGRVFLVAPQVENSGIIRAPQGEIVLAAGKSADLVSESSPYVSVRVVADAEQALNVGSLIADSGRIGMYGALLRNSGVAEANGASVGPGGQIRFIASKDLTLDAGSRVSANGTSGGQVVLQAEKGTNLIAGRVEAAGSTGQGGTVQALGVRVGVIGNGVIDASGETGGGTVLVGGDYQGKNPAVQNAERTFIGSDGVIRADARTTGDGGRVIVWADGDTRFYGAASARGGSQAGNGGFVEVSGKHNLDYRGVVDTRAPMGKAGTLLLDPDEITITHAYGGADTDVQCGGAGCSGTGQSVFTAVYGGGPGFLSDGTINAQLDMGSVLVQTSLNGIAVSGGVAIAPVSGPNSNTLTLNSATDVHWNGSWSYSNGGALALNAIGGQIYGSGTLTAGNLILSAAQGIGVDNPIQTQVINLQATNGNFQAGIEIFNNGDLTLADLGAGYAVKNIGGGLNVNAAGNINVNGAVFAGKRIGIYADGNLALNANLTANTKGGSPPGSELAANYSGESNGSVTGGGSIFTNGTSLEVSGYSVTMGSINTTGGPGNQDTSVNVTSTNGSISTGSIKTGNTSNGSAYVYVYANSGGVTTGDVTTGNSSNNSSVYIATGNNGGPISTGSITTGSTPGGSSAGDSTVYLSSSNGGVTTGNIKTADGGEGNVNIYANNGNIFTGDITTGNGAPASSTSSYINLSASGAVTTGNLKTGTAFDGGEVCCGSPGTSNVMINAGSSVTTGSIMTGNSAYQSSVFIVAGTGAGGTITTGDVQTGAATGNRGVGYYGGGSISTGAIKTSAFDPTHDGGDVIMTSLTGNITINGIVDTRGANGVPGIFDGSGSSGGSVQLSAPGNVSIGPAPTIGINNVVVNTSGGNGSGASAYGGHAGYLVIAGKADLPNTNFSSYIPDAAPQNINLNGIVQLDGGAGAGGPGGDGGSLWLLTANKAGLITFFNGGYDLLGGAGSVAGFNAIPFTPGASVNDSQPTLRIDGSLIFVFLQNNVLSIPAVAAAIGQTVTEVNKVTDQEDAPDQKDRKSEDRRKKEFKSCKA